jgi:hypothetical protein
MHAFFNTSVLYNPQGFSTKHHDNGIEIGKCVSNAHRVVNELLILAQTGTELAKLLKRLERLSK